MKKFGRVLIEPLSLDAEDAELFSYRISNLLKSLSPFQLKLARLIENKKMILKSSKMKEYFHNHSNERTLIIDKLSKLSKKFHKNIIRIPEHVPDYLRPSFLKDDERRQGKLNIFKKRMKRRQQIEGKRKEEEKNAPKKTKRIRKKKSKVIDIPDESNNQKKEKVSETNDLYEDEGEDDYGFNEDNYLGDEEVHKMEQEARELEEEAVEEESPEITKKQIRNFEHPMLRDPKSLKSFSSRKLWKQKHGIRKKKNKRLIRKGFYKI